MWELCIAHRWLIVTSVPPGVCGWGGGGVALLGLVGWALASVDGAVCPGMVRYDMVLYDVFLSHKIHQTLPYHTFTITYYGMACVMVGYGMEWCGLVFCSFWFL